MGLSFEESLKKIKKENELAIPAATPAIASLNANDSIMTLEEPMYDGLAYSGDDWTRDDDYRWFNDYVDNDYSFVDNKKNIELNENQININQESNSQFIPFEMSRFYDGIDLTTFALSIHFTRSDYQHSSSIPVNVEYNSEKIRFAWLVDKDVTAIAGDVKFEIHAIGDISDDKGNKYPYEWIAISKNPLNIVQSLCGMYDNIIEINEDWKTHIIDLVTQKITSEGIDDAVARAEAAAKSAEDTINNALTAYATKEYVQTEISNINIDNKLTEYAKTSDLDSYALKTEIPTNVSEFVNDAGYLTEHQSLEGYATEKFVTDAIDGADISEKLNDYITEVAFNSKLGNLVDIEGNQLTVEEYVKQEIDAVDVSNQLIEYAKSVDVYNKTETYSKTEIEDALKNVTVDLSDYATKKDVTDITTPLSSSIETNTENISSLSTTIGDLQEDISSIDTSPRLTYDVVYNDTEDENSGENVFVLYEITGEGTENEVKDVKKKFTITGGSGSGSSSVLKIAYVTTSPVVATVNDKVLITYNFSGTDSSGDSVSEGNYTWKIGTKIIASGIATSGENTFDATDFATTTSQKFTLTITDDAGSLVTKSWTVQQVDVRLESTFSDAYQYSGDISFNYTPYGAISKDVHFILDGKELGIITVSTSGIPMSYTLPSQEHGSHLLDVYMTTTINNTLIESNHIYKDILWINDVSPIPVIGCATPVINVVQYNTVNIKYTVFDPRTENPEVTWYINGEVASIETLTEKDEYGYYTYSYRASNCGTIEFTITCGDAEPKTITLNAEELDIDVVPVTAALEFDFNPVGYSNSSSNRLWSYNDVTITVSDNFDWINGGYQIDENGDQYFCVKSGTTAVINYNLFADDPKKTGKEFKIIFKTKNIRRRDTSFLTCMNENIGLDMKIENATIYSNEQSMKFNYCENTIIEYEFNINKDADMMIVMTYEDGTPGTPFEYTSTTSFKQTTAQPITIGSEDCDVYIYRMKAYSASLSDKNILSNFIADARNADEMLRRYYRNQIYNNDGVLISTSASGDFSAEDAMKAAPDLRYIFLEVPQFTNDKDNKVDGCTVYFRYPAGTRPQDNWTCTGMRHRGQGTSSNLYGYSGRNIDLCMDRSTSLFTWTDEEGNAVESSTITLTETSVPTDYLNIKVNIASTEHANNAQLARRFNEYQPFLRYARKKDSRVKDTMEFYNCVVFIRETGTDDATAHREFSDTNWHFYGLGNVGDSKKTDDTRMNNASDSKEFVVEIMDVDKPLGSFPTGKDNNAICSIDEWVEGNPAYDILYSEYIYDEEGAFTSFGQETFEFRYEMDGITEEQREVNINIWRDLYKFIVTSTDEEFYENLKNYFVVDTALYYYLFTERYTMVDNRCKNSFWHYGKVYISNAEATVLGETEASYYIIDDDMAAINDGYRFDLTMAYDMDTALGIDNTGDFVFSYGKEDTDYYVDGDPSSGYVFRAAKSTFFCRLRDLFSNEMIAMYKNRGEKNAWNSTSLINQWDNAQAQFPEEFWRLDYERKYYRTYLGLSVDNSIAKGIDKTFLIGKYFGRKKYSRRAFESNQEMYYATRFFENTALEDRIWFRGRTDLGDTSIVPNYSLTIVPYSDMYVCVQYGSTGSPIHQKCKAGESCTFTNNTTSMDFVYIYAASFIQELNDLSKCYIGDNSFSNGVRLRKLVLGSNEDGYDNPYMTNVLVDNNPLLEYLDIRNISGLTGVVNLTSCGNLKEFYAEGTNASGVSFANGGLLEIAHIPNVASLTMKNLNHIANFTIDSYANLQTLIIENTPNINTYTIVNNSPLLKSVRLINLNWDSTYQIADASIFDRLLTIGGIDSSTHETDVSVLTGSANVVVIKEQQAYNYQIAWPDLEITYNTMVEQYPVTFVNYNGDILDIQYVDKGYYAIEPVEAGRISTPVRESTMSTEYTFNGWDTDIASLQIFTAKTITATYSESLRQYQIKYVSNGNTLPGYPKTGYYGENLVYEGDIPTYTLEENAYKYYLFNRWDKSGFLDGDFDENGVKTVKAIFDDFTYTGPSVFENRELGSLSPVEIYALTKLTAPINKELSDFGMEIETGDDYSFKMGYDVDYDDIEAEELISENTVYSGSTYYDTGINLFDVDKDFVLAIDYKMSSENSSGATLMQCFQTAGTNGFKLSYESSPQFIWGSPSITPSYPDCREMLVIRHKKGDNNIYVYTSDIGSSNISAYTIEKSTVTQSDNATLVFGASKQDSGRFVNYAIGEINWCKIWYKDLGEETCEKLVSWTHEEIKLETSGFYRYQLHDDYTKESMMSLLATHLLSVTKQYNDTNINTGGWATSNLNNFLNNRFYDAIPYQIKTLIKKVSVSSTSGKQSSEITSSGCYITIPALYDVCDTVDDEIYRNEVYDVNGTIDFMSGLTDDLENTNRKRAFDRGGYNAYWLRSPNVKYLSYVWRIDEDGQAQSITNTTSTLGILIEISF